MPLQDLPLSIAPTALPADVRAFLREAVRRIERFERDHHVPGFVPSDFSGAYAVLRTLAGEITRGGLFCEWGSGFGVVACLAALLDFEAWGIEIDGALVEAAQQLADDFSLPVEFIRGSFIPGDGGAAAIVSVGEFAWLTTESGSTQDETGLGTDDFAVIYAYPWPDEERLTADLFEHYARAGAVLVTYHEGESFRLRRKSRRRSGKG